MSAILRCLLGLFLFVAVVPSAVYAQATIAGQVKDSSGAVLPGATVEAASPALIERTRSVVTDGNGQYKIVNLRPGTYVVTFTLSGFSTIKRDGIEIGGGATVTVNAALKVAAVEETITVSGEAPTVDVQNATAQKVFTHEVIDNIPSSRNVGGIGNMLLGVTSSLTGQDVGGSNSAAFTLALHGVADQRVMVNGANTGSLQNGQVGQNIPNTATAQEVTFDFGAVSAELPTGGVRINFIPREGGNTFDGFAFGAYTNHSLQGNDLTQELQSRGLTAATSTKENADLSGGFGGPIVKDKFWFFGTARRQIIANYPAGAFYNANAGNPNVWTYAPDTNRRGFNETDYKEGQARVTWQVTPRHKVAVSDEEQVICRCGSGVSATVSPEAAQNTVVPIERIAQADWSAPWTSRLLSEGTFLYRVERWGLRPPVEFAGGGQQIMVTDTGGALEPISNLSYHGGQAGGSLPLYNSQWVPNVFYRLSTSYVTGSHAVKFGVNDTIGSNNININAQYPYSYTFTNTKPVSITEYAAPYSSVIHQDHDFGLFAQDRWTINRLTLSGGVRYDYYKSSYPEQSAGPTQLAPNRNITFPARDNINWKDVAPRVGAVYDLTGNGKTAVRASLNKYLAGQVLVGLPVNANPVNSLVNSASRNWTDADGNYIPDCNLATAAANGECGALNNPNFGSAIPGTQYDPNLLSGWGKRNYNWEFSAGAQRELLPRVSLDVAYFRRWFGNFMATDNLALSATSFTPFTYVAPADSRLLKGGGYSIPGLVDYASDAAFRTPTQNLVTLAGSYGKQIQHWNGVDITMNARLPQGTVVQGGMSTGRQITDTCAISAALPESLITGTTYTPQSYCHQEQPFRTQVKFLAIYRVPKIDARLSATYQNLPGVAIAANQVVTTATLAQSTLGRPLSGSVRTATINLVQPLSSYGERLSQLDMRFSKIVKVGGRAVTANVDLYNALNTNTVLSENAAYRDTTATGFRVPTAILQARLVKFSVQIDF